MSNAFEGSAAPERSGVMDAGVATSRPPSWQARLAEFLMRLFARRRFTYFTDIVAFRGRIERLDRRQSKLPAGVQRVAVDAAGVPCEWVEGPQSKPGRVLLYLHGGGYMLRMPNFYARFAARLGATLGASVLTVDYRLAPECALPAATDDCLAAYRWLLGQGIPASSIVICGDSAGGNATLVTLLRAKAAGDPLPACAVALSPLTDMTLSSPSVYENADSDALFRLDMALWLRAQLAGAERQVDPFLSPLFGDLAGLPPLLLQAGSREAIRDDSARFAAKARAAGVIADLEIWNGMQHCFQLLPFLPESGRALDTMGQFIRRHAAWSQA